MQLRPLNLLLRILLSRLLISYFYLGRLLLFHQSQQVVGFSKPWQGLFHLRLVLVFSQKFDFIDWRSYSGRNARHDAPDPSLQPFDSLLVDAFILAEV